VESVEIRTCLWFDSGGLEAARFYTSLLPDSVLETEVTDGVEPLVVAFSLAGVPYSILNGGPHYVLSPAASISVTTESQAETDRLWDALTAQGGQESRCGWLIDRWGVSWQIVPRALLGMLSSENRDAAARAQRAMLEMSKIDIAALQSAFCEA
jgi:predicted 3-demethylubiquinone-9 3-methyltransferase (glyoxalase superfamily)